MALPRQFSIQPNPHWVIIDNFSRLPDGAAIYTYRSKNPTEFKAAFQDNAGQVPYRQPITGFANGTMPPIYWEFDPNNPDELYYIRVYDSDDPVTQQFLWDFNYLSGASGGGGSPIINTAYDIENLIANNVFYRNCGNQAGTPSLPTFLTLSPGNNAGFVSNLAHLNGSPAPDTTFQKSNTTASDNISFENFTPVPGANDLSPDVTPVQFLRYQCTAGGAGETYKYVQFPVSSKVQNLSGQTVTVNIYGKCAAGTSTIDLYWRQFYGDGGGSVDQDVLVNSITLSSAWKGYLVQATIPNAATNTLGACGNDGLFLQVRYPLSPATTTIDIVKPSVYLGAIPLTQDYETYDQINSVINSPRTGDIRTSLNSVILGWLNMNDGTIGSGSSNATSRANQDTYPLFNLIWTAFSATQSVAPMYTSGGVPIAYGASAIDDFVAHRQIALTRNLGRVMAGANPTAISQTFANVGNIMTVASTASFITGEPVLISGTIPTPLVANTTYYAIVLSNTTFSVATTAANAIAGTAINLTSNVAAGVITAVPQHLLGSYVGEEHHVQSVAELAAHTHSANIFGTPGSGASGAFSHIDASGNAQVAATLSTGSSTPFNVMQPTVFMNVFVKL